MKPPFEVSPAEEAANAVGHAIFHARGYCRKRRAEALMRSLFADLVHRGVLIEHQRGEWITASVQRREGEPLDGAVFRHVLRETGDANLAEQSVSAFTETLEERKRAGRRPRRL